MKKIDITLKTLSPVVLSTRGNTNVMTATRDYFTGSMLRGILAGHYIEKNDLGDTAHTNEDFLKLFIGELRFVDAYPVNGSTGTRSIALPLSLQKIKDGNSIIDLLIQDSEPNYKSLSGFGALKEGKIHQTVPAKNISMHMSRSDMKNSTGAERLAGRSISGGIYNYESLDAGQTFMGSVIGTDEALDKLAVGLKETSWTAHIGKSHYTQYGSCMVQLGDIEDIPKFEHCQGDTVCLRLETPLLMDTLAQDAAQTLQIIADQMNKRCHTDEFSIVTGKRKIFSKTEKIENFVGVWGMKRPRETALSAGTIFQLHKESCLTDDDYTALEQLCYEGIGQRTEEGFGQIREWKHMAITMADPESSSVANTPRRSITSQLVSEYAMKILTKKMIEDVRIFAAEDVENSKNYFRDMEYKHLFNRLDGMLGNNPKYSHSHIQECLENELRGENTALLRLLRKVEVQGSTLYELLKDGALADMPYNRRNWKEILYENIDNVLMDIGNKVTIDKLTVDAVLFYEYWHWFFRHGRKTRQGERWLKA